MYISPLRRVELHNLHHEVKSKSNKIGVMLKRNEFIAREIGLSLQPGETGVLFLGRLHNIENNMVKKLTDNGINVDVQNESKYTEMSILKFLQQD